MPRALTLNSFLTYYERAHQNPLNRYIHHAAHSVAVIGILVLAWHAVLGVVSLAFLLSWTGHYAFERNVPAFFDPPAGQPLAAGAIKDSGGARRNGMVGCVLLASLQSGAARKWTLTRTR